MIGIRFAGFGALLCALVLAAVTSPVYGQLSPGELAEVHKELDGSLNCFQCHRAGKGVDPGLCLACHTPLRQRMRVSEGFHGKAGLMDCKTCHIDHHGREFELIWWGEGGMESFDHSEAGYELEGSHRDLGCRDCHQADLVIDRERLLQAGKDLDRTFLGLGTQCESCHSDEHGGQFEGDGCRTCHDQQAWSPASVFDHDDTQFPLTGEHQNVACDECHQENTRGWIAYRGIPSACADCHQDVHEGRFGLDCASCHNTDDWNRVERDDFDHSRTRFPLRGAHLLLACESCHGESLERLRIPGFEQCSTCHGDTHLGQFALHPSQGQCESCHNEKAFVPSTFDVDDHARSLFPLEGAHRRVECSDCHGWVPYEQAAQIAAERGRPMTGLDLIESLPEPRLVQQFLFSSTTCESCHQDPHHGETAAYSADDGCASCHSTETWKEVDFDHGLTGFELLGAHLSASCVSCHLPSETSTEPEIRFAGTPTLCEGCHQDPHFGQLYRPETADPTVSVCSDCHGHDDWQAVYFDHNRDSRFSLEGAHADVACVACHHLEERDGQGFVRYKPIAHACSDCHGAPES